MVSCEHLGFLWQCSGDSCPRDTQQCGFLYKNQPFVVTNCPYLEGSPSSVSCVPQTEHYKEKGYEMSWE